MTALADAEPTVKLTIERSGNAPRAARRAIDAAFPDHGPMVDDLKLIASELVTNVIRHTSGEGVLQVWDTDPLLLTVSDNSTTPAHADNGVEGGRGLTIVSELAAQWGTTHTDDGKTIWVQFDRQTKPGAISPAVSPADVAAAHEQSRAVLSDFRAFMEVTSPALVVLTTTAGDVSAGCLIDMHSSCGRSPAQYAVWMHRSRHTFAVARLAPCIVLHFLGPTDGDLGDLFAQPSADTDKFDQCDWTPGPFDVPLLDRVKRRVVLQDLTVWESTGDYCCVMGTVTHVESGAAPATA